jgi:hypothetical protein
MTACEGEGGGEERNTTSLSGMSPMSERDSSARIRGGCWLTLVLLSCNLVRLA